MKLFPVNNPTAAIPGQQSPITPANQTSQSFADFVSTSISQVNSALEQSDVAVEKLHNGEAQNLHDVMIAVEQADISLRMLVQVRNKALQAYDEIMRMQI